MLVCGSKTRLECFQCSKSFHLFYSGKQALAMILSTDGRGRNCFKKSVLHTTQIVDINLPEDIRRRIISFLNTKDTVATTGLSRKWKNLWTTALVNIDFDDQKYPFDWRRDPFNRTKFGQMVDDKVLHSHNLPIIKRFHLDCIQDCAYDVHSWANVVILKKVQDLSLNIEGGYGVPIPTSLFTCETLEVLTLRGSIIVRMVALCSRPKLKKLRLRYIQYQNSESAHMLISSCPSLEELEISRIVEDGAMNFIIRSSSTLKHLTIEHGADDESDYSYVINVPGVENLYLEDVPVHGVVIENLSSLVKTDISFSDVLDIGLHDDNIHSVLQGISNSKNLKIFTPKLQSRIPAHLFPKFDRLSTLEVQMYCCNWHSLQEFIKNSDRLEALTFAKWSCCVDKKHLVCWRWNPQTVPICLLSSLKTMTFYGFEGLRSELRMVEYMLKNAKVMQKMEIHFEHSLRNTKCELQLSRQLLKFSKGSEECQVIISYDDDLHRY